MARTQAPKTDAPTTGTADSSEHDFALVHQKIKKDDGQYVAERTAFDREAWWVDIDDFRRSLWSTLANQDPSGTELADDELLVGIKLYGWFTNEDDDWSSGHYGYGEVYGTATTLAVIKPAGESAKAANSDEWEYDPVMAGSRKAYRFERVKNENGRWVSPRNGLYAPKASAVEVVYPVGEPTAVDQEPLDSTDGYPTVESDSGYERPDRTAEWSYEDALEAAHERVRQREVKSEAEQVTPLDDLSNDRGSEATAVAIHGALAGQRYLKGELDVDDLPTADENVIEITAAETVDALFKLVDEDDHDTLMDLLTDNEEESDE